MQIQIVNHYFHFLSYLCYLFIIPDLISFNLKILLEFTYYVLVGFGDLNLWLKILGLTLDFFWNKEAWNETFFFLCLGLAPKEMSANARDQ